MPNMLNINLEPPTRGLHAGLCISSGIGIHPTRTIDSHELIVVRSGRLGMFAGQEKYSLAQGEYLLLFPGIEHGGTEDYPPDLSFFWLHFDLSGKRGKKSLLQIPQSGKVRRPDHLEQLMRRYLDDQEKRELLPAQASLLVALMLAEVSDRRPPVDGAEGSGSGDTLAGMARRTILVRARKEISASDIAMELGCNPDYLGRIYRKAYGETITETIQILRMEYAKKMLLNSPKNIDEIARECGFSDPGYFRRIFKRLNGTTPGKYRKMYSRIHVNTW